MKINISPAHNTVTAKNAVYGDLYQLATDAPFEKNRFFYMRITVSIMVDVRDTLYPKKSSYPFMRYEKDHAPILVTMAGDDRLQHIGNPTLSVP